MAKVTRQGRRLETPLDAVREADELSTRLVALGLTLKLSHFDEDCCAVLFDAAELLSVLVEKAEEVWDVEISTAVAS